MNIAIRADASLHIGTGHIMRCLALANYLKQHHHNVVFFTRHQPGSLEALIANKGFDTVPMSSPKAFLAPEHSADYQSWLQVPELDDSKDFARKASQQSINFDWLIIDHYGIAADWECYVQQQLPELHILAIDDLARRHNVDLILDSTLRRSPDAYRLSDVSVCCLTGSEFALLKPEFNHYRERLLKKLVTARAPRLLIFMGGVDKFNITESLLTILLDNTSEASLFSKIDIVYNSRNKSFDAIQTLIDNDQHITLHNFVDDMALLMAHCDLAIGAPGTSSWERACLGLPAILIPVADNQNENARVLQEAGAIELLNRHEITDRLMPTLVKIIDNIDTYKHADLQITDGLGIARVYQYLSPTTCKDGTLISLQLATQQDIKRVYTWQTLEQTRKFSRKKNIPSWPEHEQWMTEKLHSSFCYFYIIQYEGKPVGVVRLDQKDYFSYEVSIFIDPSYFGLSIASSALEVLLKLHSGIDIIATVLADNTASHKLFQRANFTQLDSETYCHAREDK